MVPFRLYQILPYDRVGVDKAIAAPEAKGQFKTVRVFYLDDGNRPRDHFARGSFVILLVDPEISCLVGLKTVEAPACIQLSFWSVYHGVRVRDYHALTTYRLINLPYQLEVKSVPSLDYL